MHGETLKTLTFISIRYKIYIMQHNTTLTSLCYNWTTYQGSFKCLVIWQQVPVLHLDDVYYQMVDFTMSCDRDLALGN